METVPISIELDQSQIAMLDGIAKRTGQTRADVLSQALENLERSLRVNGTSPRNESFHEAAMRLGFLGCIKDGPPDLSTNPKYMEGFGGGHAD